MIQSLNQYQTRIERVLTDLLADDVITASLSPRLTEAMQYSTLNGGKRIRALLVYASGEATSAPIERLDTVASAIECIHAYSLIHDDLPAMDDDELRRGKPSCHVQFDEATAILAGDALLTLAFELISNTNNTLTDTQSRTINHIIAQAAGNNGMVGGQMLDILATGKTLVRLELEQIHNNKTGALIRASIMSGALCAESPKETTLSALKTFADCIGLAFQVVDDILDIESSTEVLGKTAGADIQSNKATYPALLGLDESKTLVTNLYQQSMDCLATIGDNTQLLSKLADLVVNRVH